MLTMMNVKAEICTFVEMKLEKVRLGLSHEAPDSHLDKLKQ